MKYSYRLSHSKKVNPIDEKDRTVDEKALCFYWDDVENQMMFKVKHNEEVEEFIVDPNKMGEFVFEVAQMFQLRIQTRTPSQ